VEIEGREVCELEVVEECDAGERVCAVVVVESMTVECARRRGSGECS